MKSLPIILAAVTLLVCIPLSMAQTSANVVQANVTFTTIDVPGAKYTGVWGTNTAGDMVGNYGQDTNQDSHGFLYSNGTFTYFDYPGQVVTLPHGINDSGIIAGKAGQNPVVGFTYDGTNFTTVKHGSDSATFVLAINNNGDLVGGTGSIYATKGFDLTAGKFKRLSPPGNFIYVYGTGINNFGEIVGFDDNGGFIFKNGRFQTVVFPGAVDTTVLGVNDNGVIVGWYDASGATCTCAFVLKNGKFLSFSYPGAAATAAAGINSAGQVVGQYTFDYQAWHGFVTNPIAGLNP
ncbi:MAG TPA: hypothetical protein VFA68_21375 [Terriglobales bacterium]|nr:hypothetical protein [Terriglobales bacterium]